MFNSGFENNLLSRDKFWSIWVILVFQIVYLVSYTDLLIGDFAAYFNIPGGTWSQAMIIYQDVCYGLDILGFSSYIISLGIDKGLIL